MAMASERSLGEKLLEGMGKFGDVTFVLGPKGQEEEVKSSIFVLRTLWPVFNAEFLNHETGKQLVVNLPNVQPKIFRLFLKLLLTDSAKICSDYLNSPEFSTLIEDIALLHIAKKYDVDFVQSALRIAIEKKLTKDNAILIHDTLKEMNEPELENKAFECIKANIAELLNGESFLKMSRPCLASVLKCDDLAISELTLFKGVCRWAESLCQYQKHGMSENYENIQNDTRKILGDLLFSIRFPVMTIQELYTHVQPFGILTLEETVAISCYIARKGDPTFVSDAKLQFSTKERTQGKMTNVVPLNDSNNSNAMLMPTYNSCQCTGLLVHRRSIYCPPQKRRN